MSINIILDTNVIPNLQLADQQSKNHSILWTIKNYVTIRSSQPSHWEAGNREWLAFKLEKDQHYQ